MSDFMQDRKALPFERVFRIDIDKILARERHCHARNLSLQFVAGLQFRVGGNKEPVYVDRHGTRSAASNKAAGANNGGTLSYSAA